MSEFTPAYLKLPAGEIERRVERALKTLAECEVCPRNCKVDRLKDRTAACHTGRYAQVASHFAHFGEEDCLRGWKGSGTIFFNMCNLRCVFCQNWDISQQNKGLEASPQRIAEMMLELQEEGCHNINFVTPEHVVPQILEALPFAIGMGLRLPIVYNTSSYDSMESLELMNGIVDIYMPDFKFWDPALALKYSKAKDYPEVARRVVKEMHRQVGDLVLGVDGLARRGLLVRHLVMPGETGGTREIMHFLATEVSPNTYVNIMGQYRPLWKVDANNYAEINRYITREELESAIACARAEGIERLDERWLR